VKRAFHLVEVQSVRQADSRLKPAVAQLSPGIILEVIGLPTLALNDELV
jgi:hypothetical protein